MKNIKNVMALKNGNFRIFYDNDEIIEVNPNDETEDGINLYNWFTAGNKADSYLPTREEYYNNNIGRIDALHAKFMRELTGNASIEERDTWKTKEEAAHKIKKYGIQYLEAKTALETAVTNEEPEEVILELTNNFNLVRENISDAQFAMIYLESEADELNILDMADKIIEKADGFTFLIGVASKIKIEAKKQMHGIVFSEIPIADLDTHVKNLEDYLSNKITEEIIKWKESTKNKNG